MLVAVTHMMMLLALFSAAFFAGLVAVNALKDSLARYQKHYLASSQQQLSDMFMFVDQRALSGLGLGLMVLGGCSALLLGPIGGILLATLGLLSPPLLVSYYQRQRIEALERQLPDALAAVAGAMRSGLTFRQAMAETGNLSPAPMGQELQLFAREVQLGTPLDEALSRLSERTRSNEFGLFVSSAQIALRVGGNLSEILEGLAATLRERFRIEGRIRSLTAQGKLQGVIVGLMPIFVWLGFDFFRPDLTRPMMSHWFGAAMVALVVAMELIGALLIRRIVRIEL